jgi:hypothetical protein
MLATILYFVGMITTSPVITIKFGNPKVVFDSDYYLPPSPPPPPPPIDIWKGYRENKWWNPPPSEDYDGDSS